MENLEEAANTTVDLEALEDTNVLQCAASHARRFVSCDVPLSDKVTHSGLLAPLEPFRGEPSLVPKGKCVYPVDDPSQQELLVHVVPPAFPSHRPPTLRFFSVYADLPPVEATAAYPQVAVMSRTSSAPVTKVERVVFHPVSQGCMRQGGVAVVRAGRRPSGAEGDRATAGSWNIYWGARFKSDADFRLLAPYQRVNHFPGTFLLGRKDNLAKQISAHRFLMKSRKRDDAFDFVPMSYSIPADLKLLARDAAEGHIFIVKPPASACGRGIFLFRGTIPREIADFQHQQQQRPAAAPAPATAGSGNNSSSDDDTDDDGAPSDGEEYLVQRYIQRPFLLNGYKVDLRLYVAVTSFDPLRAYIFNDGLVRFASEPYPTDMEAAPCLENLFSHLTNYSINKKSEKYVKTNAAEDDGVGSKWSLHALRRYFESHNLDWAAAWRSITDVVVKTLIAAEADVCSKMMQSARFRGSCFELYGFDVMLDAALKAFLVEVNVMPSLACASALDKHIKGHLIADLLTLAGVPLVPRDDPAQQQQQQQQQPGVNMPFAALRQTPAVKALLAADNPVQYFATEATPDDKQVLRDSEEELRRCGGFARLLPNADCKTRYAPLFSSSRHFNLLLWQWEALKATFTPAERDAAVLWLRDAGPFPRGKAAAAAAAPAKPQSSSSAAAAAAAVASSPAAPRPKRALSSSRLTNARVSSAPKHVVEKPPPAEVIPKAPIRVCTFTFVDVKKK